MLTLCVQLLRQSRLMPIYQMTQHYLLSNKLMKTKLVLIILLLRLTLPKVKHGLYSSKENTQNIFRMSGTVQITSIAQA